jgi:hypothetical protein
MAERSEEMTTSATHPVDVRRPREET